MTTSLNRGRSLQQRTISLSRGLPLQTDYLPQPENYPSNRKNYLSKQLTISLNSILPPQTTLLTKNPTSKQNRNNYLSKHRTTPHTSSAETILQLSYTRLPPHERLPLYSRPPHRAPPPTAEYPSEEKLPLLSPILLYTNLTKYLTMSKDYSPCSSTGDGSRNSAGTDHTKGKGQLVPLGGQGRRRRRPDRLHAFAQNHMGRLLQLEHQV